MKSVVIILFAIVMAGCAMTQAEARRQSIEKKLDAIVFSEIDFHQAEKFCGLKFFSDLSKGLDKEGKGVDIVYIPSDVGLNAKNQSNPANSFGDTYPGDFEGRPFTFAVHNVSLREALNIICELGGFTWKIEDSVIKVSLKQNKVQTQPDNDEKIAAP